MKPHIIQRQIFELSTARASASLWDASASRFQQEVILHAIEVCFQDFSSPNEHIIIDRMEIDLGVFAPDQFLQQGYERLVGLLRRELQKIRASHEQQISEDFHGSVAEREVMHEDRTEKKWIINSSKASYLAFIKFIQAGRFPWWYHTDASETMEEQFKLEWIQSLSSGEKNELRSIVTTSLSAQIRIVNHFKSTWLCEFLEAIGLSGHEGLQQWKLFALSVLKFPAVRLRFHQNFWSNWIARDQSHEHCPDIKSIFEKTFYGHRQGFSDVLEALQNTCLENIKDPAMARSSTIILKELANLYTTEGGQLPDLSLHINAKPDGKQKSNVDADTSSGHEDLRDLIGANLRHKADKKTHLPDDDEDESVLFVQGAGMVLLHPFLAELFTSLGVWQDARWTTDESSFKALQVLSFLCFGDPFAPEHQLVFLKTLAGIDVDTVPLAQQPLTLKEMEACMELLTAVVQHWKALRNTSPDGLREVFLQRSGKLSRIDDGQMLVVERKTQDVLLSHIPWGYSLIKLPWMERMLHISWI